MVLLPVGPVLRRRRRGSGVGQREGGFVQLQNILQSAKRDLQFDDEVMNIFILFNDPMYVVGNSKINWETDKLLTIRIFQVVNSCKMFLTEPLAGGTSLLYFVVLFADGRVPLRSKAHYLFILCGCKI